MSRRLSSSAEGLLDRKIVSIVYVLTINNIEVIPSSYSCEYSREFGSATMSFTLPNNEGQYSAGGDNEIHYGDTVVLSEGIIVNGGSETFVKFTGEVRSANPSVSSGGMNEINIKCLDKIISLEGMDIDGVYESPKTAVSEEVLVGYEMSSYTGHAQVFSFIHSNLCQSPPPSITVKSKDWLTVQPIWNGHEINYSTGQVVLGSAIDITKFDITSSYSYYPLSTACFIEDVLELLLLEPDGYGNNVFTSANITETINNWEGIDYDELTPVGAGAIDIKTDLKVGLENTGGNTIYVDDTSNFESINGKIIIEDEIITYASTTGGTTASFNGCSRTSPVVHNIPVSVNQYYDANIVWSFKYNNIQDNMVAGNFTLPSGRSLTILPSATGPGVLAKRYGFVVLDSAYAGSKGDVRYNLSYAFKTLQATGIQINGIEFREQQYKNRMECVQKLREQLAPNYTIRTVGSSKIWASYIYQKADEDFELKLKTSIQYTMDENVYSRVKVYGQNSSPHNLMHDLPDTNATLIVGADPNYVGHAVNTPLCKKGTDTTGKYDIYWTGNASEN